MSSAYGPEYYQHSCGLPYDRSETHWSKFFGHIADQIAERLAPSRVLDIGCAKGFLVEALRDRGVEAFGFDVSEYAIGEVRPDIRRYCWVGSVSDSLREHYDLITCIEVLEHVSEEDGRRAIRTIAGHADAVLFSSTPNDFTEPTHVNVRPVLYWLKEFREAGFAPDLTFDAGFISAQAMLLRKSSSRPSDEVLAVYARTRELAIELEQTHIEVAKQTDTATSAKEELESARRRYALEVRMLRAELEHARKGSVDPDNEELLLSEMSSLEHALEERKKLELKLANAEQQLQTLRPELDSVKQSVLAMESSMGWRLVTRFRSARDRVLPLGTTRRRWSDLAQRSTKILLLEGVSQLRSAWRKRRSRTAPKEIASYAEWIAANEPGPAELAEQKTKAATFAYRPLISAIMPAFNPDMGVLKAAIGSLCAQTYDNWELCIAGTAPAESAAEISQWAEQDRRIRLNWLPKNLGISGNSNECLRLAKGEFVVFLDQDDTLAPFALYEVVRKLNAAPDLDFIYTDKDLLSADGSRRFSPLCKPDWSPEVMLSANYLSHMSAIRKELVDRAGGFRPEFDGAQDWDLFLRVLSKTDRIAHVPVIAYHWRELPTSAASGINAKPYAQQKQLEVVTSHLQKFGLRATATFTPSGPLRVKWPVSGQSVVSIIIPNRDKVELLKRCIESLAEHTRYRNFEIIVVENGSTEASTFRYYDQLRGRANIKVVTYERSFNYSAVNNFGAQQASGNLLLFLNNDTEAIDGDWLEEMVRWAERPEIGAVGAKLLYKDDRIQHAGVVVGLGGFAGHVYSGCREGQWDCFGSTEWYRNYSAVTGACLMVRKDVFERAGGFDEQFELCGGDVEFCLRLREGGYRNVYTPFAKMLHHESATRGTSIPAADFQHSFSRYEPYLRDGDPYFNPNLSHWDNAPRLRSRDSLAPLTFCREFLERLPQSPAKAETSSAGLKAKEPQRSSTAVIQRSKRKPGAAARRATTWMKRRVMRSRLARLIPLWSRYSYDATVLASWLDYGEADLRASQGATASDQPLSIQTVNWFIPEVEHAAFGGIHTILRFASQFKRIHGVQNRFIVIGAHPVSRTTAAIGGAFPELADEPAVRLSSLDQMENVPAADASIATLWLTAYFLLRFNNTKRKFYFIQDCEPMFYPAGSTAAQAEATYRFGFYGIANTRTLKHMYQERYQGVAEYFDPAVDPTVFHPGGTPSTRERLKIFFYGRPDHPRNAFELGLAAFKKVKAKLGDRVEIVSAGAEWQPRDFGVEGVVQNLGLLSYLETAELYRTCDIGLLLMFTRHPSYIPLELMASGCVVVTNWNPDTAWLMQDGVNCILTAPAATVLAESIVGLANDPDRRRRLRLQALRVVGEKYSDWTAPIEKIFEFMRWPHEHSLPAGPALTAQDKA